MATFVSLGSFGNELEKMRKELAGAEKRKITGAMAKEAQKAAERVGAADIGADLKMRGWAPTLETQVKFTSSNAALVSPTRLSAGPWTVRESGRNQGNASGFSGPGINTRTGVTSRTKSGGLRKVRARKARRWNGYTQGKGTGSKAVAAMEKVVPSVAEDGVRRVFVRHFDVS